MVERYQYRRLGDEGDEDGNQRQIHFRGRRARRMAIAMCLTFGTLIIFLFAYTWGTLPELPFHQSCHDREDGYQCKPEISHHWGQYSPFFSAPSDISADIPEGCEITFAQVLSRHGSRDPTFTHTVAYAVLIERLKQDVSSFTGAYTFLKDYKYAMGADQLTVFGQNEMYRSGLSFYKRYRSLTNETVPFVRASGQTRVVMSAENFTTGMRQAAKDDKAESADSYPLTLNTLSESKTSNNTLSNELCDALESGPISRIGEAARQEYASFFVPPIQDRLNADMPGANLTEHDVLDMMDMCPFDTVASPTGSTSPFCGLFAEDEWASYDYYQSLGKFYSHGPGNPLGPTQGVGFVNELIARLTGKSVQDHTSVNHTLDTDPHKFPIGEGHVLFADFSHDNDITAVFGALGLYSKADMLSNSTRINATDAEGYSAAWTVPFAARAYFEKMRCPAASQEYVRVLVNDRVLPLDQCGGDALGRCPLNDFIGSLKFARKGGRWSDCFNSQRRHG